MIWTNQRNKTRDKTFGPLYIKQKFPFCYYIAGIIIFVFIIIFFLWRCDPTRVMVSSFLRFLDHIQRRITNGRTPLDEGSARHRELYLTTHNTHNRQTSMPPVGFEPTISAGERPKTYELVLLVIKIRTIVKNEEHLCVSRHCSLELAKKFIFDRYIFTKMLI
jgi:hypothetical protein